MLKPTNFQSRMRRHYQSGKVCQMGPRCGFAHGEHELMSKNKPAEKRKTHICVSFTPGGSGYCKDGLSCDFLHPTDGHLFNTAVQFQIEKEQFNFTIQTIHSKRRFCSTQEESDGLEDVINHIVRLWNQKWPKGPFYFDLHAMTTKGAEKYVEDTVVCMKVNNQKACWLETGRGNHSTFGFAAIRTLLLAKYQGRQIESWNCNSEHSMCSSIVGFEVVQ
ncbi:hypothetical protein L3Y34_019634 [Caenorhabditis briggsae]|uniref:C3H1-type domain-containing protein n=1 Tax=Caenorhabditis briggsae TaxID=6238 RepID=A0AAE9DPH5_CAEBR|nr:hypothetical protein L3Y34_019634 [Caenorhabditis briggsae]